MDSFENLKLFFMYLILQLNSPDHHARGILRYNSASTRDPTTVRKICTKLVPCQVLNCQFTYYSQNMNTECTRIDQLTAASGEPNPTFDEGSLQLFQNWVIMAGGSGVNGKLFLNPDVSALTQPKDIRKDLSCDVCKCAKDKICSCLHEVDVPYNQTIQMIWVNHGQGAIGHHSIHLHGQSFHALKMVYAVYNNTTGQNSEDNTDINCSPSDLCNATKFRDSSWVGDNIPNLNLANPPQKDTLMIPVGSYAVV